jgi:tripartite-type tricarboxylate transporter receptor subunit TctC
MRLFLRLILILLAASCMVPGGVVRAQDSYPTKTIFFVVGPGPDTVARLIAQKMAADWGQQVLVDPQPAGGGLVAVHKVANAAPDGYTLLLTTGSYSINEILRPRQTVKLMRDLAPVVEIASLPFVVLVPSSLPVETLADLVKLARSKPGEINCASSGVGTTAHLGCALFNDVAKINTTHVPYKGLGPAIVDLIAGRVQIAFSVPTTLQYVKGGQLRALAVTGSKRLPSLPEVPTVAEAGFADLEFTSWNGVHVPAGTPIGLIAKLNAEISKIRNLPEMQHHLADLGFIPEGGTPEQFGKFVRTDIERWEKVVKETGVKVE